MSTCIDPAWLAQHPEVLHSPRRTRPDRAHPYAPGSGPKGQTCGTCAKCVCRQFRHKRYYKCHVLMKTWTGGAATDIKLRDPACRSWEPRIDKVEVVTTWQRQ
jgi:hypothetical protein